MSPWSHWSIVFGPMLYHHGNEDLMIPSLFSLRRRATQISAIFKLPV